MSLGIGSPALGCEGTKNPSLLEAEETDQPVDDWYGLFVCGCSRLLGEDGGLG